MRDFKARTRIIMIGRDGHTIDLFEQHDTICAARASLKAVTEALVGLVECGVLSEFNTELKAWSVSDDSVG